VRQQKPGASVEPLDSPGDPAEQPSSIKDQACNDCEPEVKQNSPGASGQPQESPHDLAERPCPVEPQTADGCDQGMEQQGSGASVRPDSAPDDQGSSASEAETNHSNQHYWSKCPSSPLRSRY
jgi:hypothetical protein